VGGGYVIGAKGMEAVYYKAGTDNQGRVTIFGPETFLGMALSGLGHTLPGAAVFYAVRDLSAKAAGQISGAKPYAAEVARLYAEETKNDWALWHRKGNSIYFDLTAEENIKAFLRTYYGYYAANSPTIEDLKEVLNHLDISFGGAGGKDIIAVYKEPVTSVPTKYSQARVPLGRPPVARLVMES